MQERLGQADPGFTLRLYVHLLDEGLGGTDFLDAAVSVSPAEGSSGWTHGPETASAADKQQGRRPDRSSTEGGRRPTADGALSA